MSPTTLRARAAGYFLTPRPPIPPPVDLIPLVRREPPPAAGAAPAPPHRSGAASCPPERRPDRPGAAPFRPPDRLGAALLRPSDRTDAAVRPLDRADAARFRPSDRRAWRPDRRAEAPAPEAGYAALRESCAGAFVAPSPGEPIRFAARAAVLGPAAVAVPAAAALGCALRAVHGFPVAVVATWTPGAPQRTPIPRGPAAPAAARVAARLAARGLAATAHGRLAWLALDDHVLAASVAARRAAGALDVPFVVALAGARCDIVESLLAEQDLVLVVTAEPDGALARLAVAACPRPAAACPPLVAARRALALSGFAGARALGRALPAGGALEHALRSSGAPEGGAAFGRPR